MQHREKEAGLGQIFPGENLLGDGDGLAEMLLFGVEAGNGQVDPLRLVDNGAETLEFVQGLAVLLLQQVDVHQGDAGGLVMVLAGDDVPVEGDSLVVAVRLDEQLAQLHLQLA